MKFTEKQIRDALKIFVKEDFQSEDCFLEEMRYAYSTKRADLVVIKENSYVFEIKSDFDNDKRLYDQMNDYCKTFDYVYLVTTKNKYRSFSKDIDKKIGVIIYNGISLIVKRKAKEIKRLSKYHLACSCTRAALLTALGSGYSTRTFDDLLDDAVNILSLDCLRGLFKNEIHRKINKLSLI